MLMKSQTVFKGQIFQKKDPNGQPQPWYSAGTYQKNNGMPGQWARFSVAVWQKKDKQQDKNIYEYFNCTVYDTQAEALPYFFEGGDFVLIVGEIGVDNYQDNSGQMKKSVKVIVSEMGKMPNPFAKNNNQPIAAQQYQQPQQIPNYPQSMQQAFPQQVIDQGVQQMQQAFAQVKQPQATGDEVPIPW